MRVGVTGAGGYVGSRLCLELEARGHEVVTLGRRPLPEVRYEFRRYDLEEPLHAEVLDGLEAVVHCAWDMRASSPEAIGRINVGAVRRLVAAAAVTESRLCLISSMSAYAGTRQLYGRAKLRCEEVAGEGGGRSVRLGLVYGDVPAGMFGALRRLARLPVIPLIGARSHQFLVHEDDMAAGVVALLPETQVPQPLGLAHPVPVPFKSLMRDLAMHQQGRFLSVPLPWRPIYRSMNVVESAGITLPLRADSVLGLVRPASEVPNHPFWGTLDVHPRPYPLTERHG